MKWIDRIFKTKHIKSRVMKGKEIASPQVEMMLQMIEKTQTIELSCDDVHKLLDQYTELAIQGDDAAVLLPLVHNHLALCPDCREEFEALKRILEAHLE
jgi:hypothetical protein